MSVAICLKLLTIMQYPIMEVAMGILNSVA